MDPDFSGVFDSLPEPRRGASVTGERAAYYRAACLARARRARLAALASARQLSQVWKSESFSCPQLLHRPSATRAALRALSSLRQRSQLQPLT